MFKFILAALGVIVVTLIAFAICKHTSKTTSCACAVQTPPTSPVIGNTPTSRLADPVLAGIIS